MQKIRQKLIGIFELKIMNPPHTIQDGATRQGKIEEALKMLGGPISKKIFKELSEAEDFANFSIISDCGVWGHS